MYLEDFILLFCNGEPPSRARLDKIIKRPVKVVCADGGAQKALSIGYKPDIIVGDLDSVDLSDPRLSSVEVVRAESQEHTDFEKTLKFVLERDWNNILVTAFSGGRMDHTLANIQIAYEYARQELGTGEKSRVPQIILVDQQFTIYPVARRLVKEVSSGMGVSIVPMEDLTVVSTRGLEYELQSSRLPRGGHGVSNRATRNEIEIVVESGGIMLFIEGK